MGGRGGRGVGHEIVFDQQAIDDLKSLRAYDRTAILDAIDRILSATPTQASKSRIKRLRGVDSPMYRLRIDDYRVFYDVVEDDVQVMRVIAKEFADAYLREMGYEAQDG
jgi:addiction module RelE/StbE family toxin